MSVILQGIHFARLMTCKFLLPPFIFSPQTKCTCLQNSYASSFSKTVLQNLFPIYPPHNSALLILSMPPRNCIHHGIHSEGCRLVSSQHAPLLPFVYSPMSPTGHSATNPFPLFYPHFILLNFFKLFYPQFNTFHLSSNQTLQIYNKPPIHSISFSRKPHTTHHFYSRTKHQLPTFPY
jgi:hypothetical protein